MKIAIVGITGAVGAELRQLLEVSHHNIELSGFASARSVGCHFAFRGKDFQIDALTATTFSDTKFDIVFFAAGKSVSLIHVPNTVRSGALVIDGSSAYRLDPKVPLVIPEINRECLSAHHGVIASPNCTATLMLMALAPLHRVAKIKRIVASTYQAASGAGKKAVEELYAETAAHLAGHAFQRTVSPLPYAFNLFTHPSTMTASFQVEEEVKVIEESRKILNEPTLKIAITCVRVPVIRVHAEALNVEFHDHLSAEQATTILDQTPGIKLFQMWEQNRFATPLDAAGRQEIFCGRIREDSTQPNTLDLWVVGDQLLKGAALNMFQIFEKAIYL